MMMNSSFRSCGLATLFSNFAHLNIAVLPASRLHSSHVRRQSVSSQRIVEYSLARGMCATAPMAVMRSLNSACRTIQLIINCGCGSSLCRSKIATLLRHEITLNIDIVGVVAVHARRGAAGRGVSSLSIQAIAMKTLFVSARAST